MNDRELENLLMDEVLENSLDNEVVKSVTPWKNNFKLIVAGLVLSTIQISFIDSWDVLPLLGIVLLMLGFRGLKSDSKWFLAGYVFASVHVVLGLVSRLIACSIWNKEIWSMPYFANGYEGYLSIALTGLTYVCLWRAIIKAEKKAGITVHSVSPVMLVIWYILVAVITLLEIAGTAASLILIAGYIIIMVGIGNIYKELDNVGYVLKPSKILIPNSVIIIAFSVIYVVSVFVIYMNNEYPMEWKEYSVEYNDEQKAIKENLMELGVPAAIIDDLKLEDLEMCANAVRVVIYEKDLPLNEGYTHTEVKANGVRESSTKYDVYELHMTSVAVQLDETGLRWRMIYHFDFIEDPNFKGTETLKIYESELVEGEAWINGDITGQVIYEKDERTYSSKYYNLERKEYSTLFFSTTMNFNDIFATFSFDEKADDYRGYVSYEIEGFNEDILESWISIDYYHQEGRFIYPAMTSYDIAEKDLMLLSDKYFMKERMDVYRSYFDEEEEESD